MRNRPRLTSVLLPAFLWTGVACWISVPVHAAAQITEMIIIPPGGDANPPTVTITPVSGTYDVSSLPLTVEWCDNAGLVAFTRSIAVNGTDVTGTFSYSTGYKTGCTRYAKSQGTVTLTAGASTTVLASIEDPSGNTGARSVRYDRPAPPPPTTVPVEVTPDGGDTLSVPPSTTGNVATFTVTGSGTPTCSYTGSVSACSVAGGNTVRFTTSGAGTGTVSLSVSGNPGDAGRYIVRVQRPELRVLGGVGTNPARLDLSRGSCLRLAAGPAADMQCGDLVVAHPLPDMQTLGKDRTPVLLYNSATATPRILAHADVSVSSTIGATSVSATLLVNNNPVASGTWSAGYFTNGYGRIALSGTLTGTGDLTNLVPYTVRVTASGGSQTYTETVYGKAIVVDRSGSPFGAGWWIAGLERLKSLPGSDLLWVGGDGSSRVYSRAGLSSIWIGANRSRPDTLKLEGSYYVRKLPDGARVLFDQASLLHRYTEDRNGNRTEFTYAGSSPSRINLPTVSGSAYYTLAYSSGLVDYIIQGNRKLNLTVTSGRLVTIQDPDLKTVQFTYATGNLIRDRYDRNGVPTRYEYDIASKVRMVRLDYGGLNLTTGIIAQEGRGAATSGTYGPLPSAAARTKIDGPRPILGDSTVFYLNEYSEVVRIVQGVGSGAYTTTVRREEQRFPALVTWTEAPNGRRQSATYDSLGLVTAVQDNSTGARTDYQYGDAACPNYPTWMETAEGVKTQLRYDTRCNLRLRYMAGDSTNRGYRYAYNTRGQVTEASSPVPAGQSTRPVERYTYDGTLGNLRQITTAVGGGVLHDRDGFGRVYRRQTTLSTSQTRTERVYYDAISRDTLTITSGPRADPTGHLSATTESLSVFKTYDATGNLVRLRRVPSPNPANLVLDERWTFDRIGRMETATASNGQVERYAYDEAGNVIFRRPRTCGSASCEIATTYDNLNRPERTVVPARTFTGVSPRFALDPLAADTLTIPADTSAFTYDASGMRSAYNREARIRRTYLPDGLLRTDSVWIRDHNSNGFGSVYGIRYAYDKDRRLTSLYYPYGTAPGSSPDVNYGWNVDGTLKFVSDLAGHQHTYGYDAQGNPAAVVMPGGRTETFTYDAGSRPKTHVTNPWRNASYVVDLSDRLSRSYGDDFFVGDYTSLGPLVEVEGGTREVSAPDYSDRPERTVFSVDPLGNEVYSQVWSRHGTATETWTNYDQRTGAVRSSLRGDTVMVWVDFLGYEMRFRTIEEASFFYDAAGNRIRTHRVTGYKPAPPDWYYGDETEWEEEIEENTHSYYDYAGRLRAVDQRKTFVKRPFGTRPWQSSEHEYEPGATYDEFRYDALGRRIAARSRPAADCTTWCRPYFDLYVWAGDQLIHEVRRSAPGATSTGAYYGRATYTFGAGGIDAAVSVLRQDEGSPYSVALHSNRKGQFDMGTNSATGARVDSTRHDWAGSQWPMYPRTVMRQLYKGAWLGSLITEKRDGSGLFYMRNRYYDPHSGQFTQPDPIGFAGGLNLYGYANGDPVSYSDPFGLCPEFITGRPCSTAVAVVVGFVPVVGDAYDVISAAVGKDLLTGEQIGKIGVGATLLGTVLGSGKLARMGADAVGDAMVVVRGGQGAIPPAGTVFSGAAGRTLEEASGGVPHGTIRATTAGDIRAAGGSVVWQPELTRSGVMNDRHVNICLGSGACPFGPPMPNPVPKSDRIR